MVRTSFQADCLMADGTVGSEPFIYHQPPFNSPRRQRGIHRRTSRFRRRAGRPAAAPSGHRLSRVRPWPRTGTRIRQPTPPISGPGQSSRPDSREGWAPPGQKTAYCMDVGVAAAPQFLGELLPVPSARYIFSLLCHTLPPVTVNNFFIPPLHIEISLLRYFRECLLYLCSRCPINFFYSLYLSTLPYFLASLKPSC